MRRTRIPPVQFTVMLCGLLVMPPLLSAGPAGSDTPGVEPPAVRFRIMGLDAMVSDLCFVNEDGIQSFIASHSRPTAWMETRGIAPIPFYRTSDLDALAEGSPPAPVMAWFAPPGPGDWLLLFVRDPQAGDTSRFRVLPIPDDAGDVREGLRFYNLTQNELAVQVNDELLRLPPGQQGQINPGPGPDAGMDMQIAARRESGWEKISATVFGHRPRARITFYLIEVNGRFQIKRFLERI